MASISFKNKILMLVLLPLIAVSAGLTLLSIYQVKNLGAQHIDSFSDKIFEIRRSELKNYTKIAASALKDIYEGSAQSPTRKEEAKALLRNLSFGEDGYFFAFDWNGTNMAHPQKPELEGKNFWDLQDPNGVFIMRSQVTNSKKIGGGYTDYVWEKTSLNRDVDKISYSLGLDDWQWGIATGLYVDDLEDAVSAVKNEVDKSISNTLIFTAGLSVFFTLLVAVVGVRLTITESALADNKLKELSHKVVVGQDEERAKIASRLNTKVIKNLNFLNKKLIDLIKDDRDLTDELKLSSSVVTKTIKDIHSISAELRPDVLDTLGLYSAIEGFIKSINEKNIITVTFKKSVVGARLRAELETAVYRIVEEAIKNCVLHSKANTANVRIRQTRDLLHITIRDDGVGVDVRNQKSNTNGINSMKLRAESMGGTLTFFSSTEKGSFTIVTAQIPL